LQITGNLNSKFEGLITAAKTIKTAVENNHQSFSSNIPAGMEECCKATGVTSSLKFLSEVTLISS